MGRSTTTSSIRSTNSARSTRSGRSVRSLGKARKPVAGSHEVKTGYVPARVNAACTESDWEPDYSIDQDGNPAHIECEDMGRRQGAGERPSVVHQSQLRMHMPTPQHRQQEQALPNMGRPRSSKMSRSPFQEEIDSTSWKCGDQYNYRPPLQKDPWERCRSLTTKYDAEICSSWKAEIDNILIFAGLFSASVTAFLIESYKWLQPDSGTYVSQLLTLTYESFINPVNAQEKLSTLSDPFPQSASERINIYWFLSLTLSLATVLVGIIATQWLREYQRDVLLSSKAKLALRQMRHEGLQYWSIPRIVAMLPLLLQCACILFLLGIVEMLWILNRRVAIPITIAVGFMLLFLATTVVLPTLQFIFPGNDYLRVAQCAYKSPQSLAVLRFVSGALRLMPQRLKNSISQYKTFARLLAPSWHWSWTDFDLYWRETRDQGLMSKEVARKSSKDSDDIVHALKWVLKTFNQTTENITIVLQCIHDLPLRVAIEVVRSKHWPCVLPEMDVFTVTQCSDEVKHDILNVALMQRFSQTNEPLRTFYWESQIRLMNSRVPRNILDWYSDCAFPNKLPDEPAMHLQLAKALIPLISQGVASSTDVYYASLVIEASASSRQHSEYRHRQTALDSHLVQALEMWLASPNAGQNKPLRDRILHLREAFGSMVASFDSVERAEEARSNSMGPSKKFDDPMYPMHCHDGLPRPSDQPYQSPSWPFPNPRAT
ncbi:unnamed protein product [Cyclocybe aegerita]|uniref:DUF6535 domain-containing protein n=1 Tax=Cyclocybe aegerita TaxID=1973307 RepID=A0A8S0WSA6_CYCAE|nr:unnamed protein product [Cyclocybe aegerita]